MSDPPRCVVVVAVDAAKRLELRWHFARTPCAASERAADPGRDYTALFAMKLLEFGKAEEELPPRLQRQDNPVCPAPLWCVAVLCHVRCYLFIVRLDDSRSTLYGTASGSQRKRNRDKPARGACADNRGHTTTVVEQVPGIWTAVIREMPEQETIKDPKGFRLDESVTHRLRSVSCRGSESLQLCVDVGHTQCRLREAAGLNDRVKVDAHGLDPGRPVEPVCPHSRSRYDQTRSFVRRLTHRPHLRSSSGHQTQLAALRRPSACRHS